MSTRVTSHDVKNLVHLKEFIKSDDKDGFNAYVAAHGADLPSISG